MQPGDPKDRGSRTQPSDQTDTRAPTTSQPPASSDPRPPSGSEQDESVDFGSYVSSTVRSSAELFGTPARSAPVRRRQPSDPSVTPTPTAPPRTTAPVAGATSTAQPSTDTASRERPARYWRDSVAPEEPEYEPEVGGDGGTGRPIFPWALGDGQRPGLNLVIGAVLLALIAIAALVWWLLQDDENNQQAPPPTGTTESVFDAVATEIPEDDATPPFMFPTDASGVEPTEAPTPTPRRGGDNQRDQDDETPEDENGADVDLDSIELGPVASQCSDRCMVRVQSVDDLGDLMSTALTRPSFSSAEWTWVVATAPGIAYLEQNAETVFVLDSPDTLALYMATTPPEETSDDRLSQVGTMIDSVGPYRLLRADHVPANVRPLTDWGYQVQKVAPATPTEVLVPEEPIPLANIEIGALIDEVSGATIEQDIRSLQAMGDDANGIGTRYYTTAGNSEAAEFLFQRLESYGLRVWYEDFLSWEGYLMVNVVAEIRGADESAIYGVMAHFDSIATDINVAPGGDDNATGVSGALEIARILGGYQLQHPVHIVFVNVEEVGIVGSEHFAQQAKANGVPYEGIFNLDSIGAQRQYAYMVVNGNDSTAWMIDLFREINETYGLGQVINAQTNEEIVADDNRLRDNGIDAIMIARELYGDSPTHHTSDDLVETVWIDGVVSCTQLTLLSVASLVQA